MDKDVTDPQWNLTQPQNDWNNAICSNTDGPRDYCTKCGNSDRKTKNHTSQMWNLKNWCKWTHVQNRKEAETKKTNLQAREGKEGGNKLRVWDTHTHILLFIKWINSKVLLYSTRNYIQHHKCVCIQLLSRTRLFVTPEKWFSILMKVLFSLILSANPSSGFREFLHMHVLNHAKSLDSLQPHGL